jgi:hypothetical protein
MKKKIVCSITVSFFLLILTIAAVSAPPIIRLPGVNSGDFFLYDLEASFSSNDPNAKPPYGFDNTNSTEWVRMDVTSVINRTINYQVTTHYKNGTETANTGSQNVESGYGGTFVAANLNANDSLYSSGYYSNWIINDTVVTLYPSGARQTNRVNITMTQGSPPGNYLSQNQRQYYDRETGAMVEIAIGYFNHTGIYATQYSLRAALVNTNRWLAVPEYPSFVILPLFMIATLLAVMVYKRKRTKYSIT